jgi:hypothetical protein
VVDGATIADTPDQGCHDRGMSTLFTHVPHPHIEERRAQAPVKVADQLQTTGRAAKANSWLAVKITNGVGTMWCAYVFTVLALLSLPAVLSAFSIFGGVFPGWLVKSSLIALVAWVAQTFLQLVLLSIIIVGQNIQSSASDKRAEATFNDADAVLHEALQIQDHLEAQDKAIENILALVKSPGSLGTTTA